MTIFVSCVPELKPGWGWEDLHFAGTRLNKRRIIFINLLARRVSSGDRLDTPVIAHSHMCSEVTEGIRGMARELAVDRPILISVLLVLAQSRNHEYLVLSPANTGLYLRRSASQTPSI